MDSSRDTTNTPPATVATPDKYGHGDTVIVDLPEPTYREVKDQYPECKRQIPGVVVSDIADASGDGHVPVWVMPPGAPDDDITVYGFDPRLLTHDALV